MPFNLPRTALVAAACGLAVSLTALPARATEAAARR